MEYVYAAASQPAEAAQAAQAAQGQGGGNVYVYKPGPTPAPASPALPAYSVGMHFYAVAHPVYMRPFPYAYQSQAQPQVAAVPQAYYYVAAPAKAAVQPAAVQPAATGTAENPYVWTGESKEEVDRQNAAIAQAGGATKQHAMGPINVAGAQDFWCRELDGSYTLRSHMTIQEALQPGHWAVAKNGGYPYFIRQAA
ncbi:MAG: hypothetical protein M1832_004214 [Thelocarpon impressellum]|nr:MAG: hypothetical protein M1832_004214 [Thelocarpon impressellum]